MRFRSHNNLDSSQEPGTSSYTTWMTLWRTVEKNHCQSSSAGDSSTVQPACTATQQSSAEDSSTAQRTKDDQVPGMVETEVDRLNIWQCNHYYNNMKTKYILFEKSFYRQIRTNHHHCLQATLSPNEASCKISEFWVVRKGPFSYVSPLLPLRKLRGLS